MLKLKPGPSLISGGKDAKNAKNAGDEEKRDEKKSVNQTPSSPSILFQLKRSPNRKKHEHRFPFKRNSQYTPSPLMISSTIKIVPSQSNDQQPTTNEQQPLEQSPEKPLIQSPEKEPIQPSSPPSPPLIAPVENKDIKEPPQKQQKVAEKEEEKEKKVTVNQKGFNFKLNLSKIKMNTKENDVIDKNEKVKADVIEKEEEKEEKEEIKKEVKESEKVNDDDNSNDISDEETLTETSPRWKRLSILRSEIDETFILLKKTEAELSDITKMFDDNFSKDNENQ